MKEATIVLEGVRKVYGRGRRKVEALRGVSLKISPGEMVAIVGPSGAGKTTLLNIIGALEVPTEGRVAVRGIDLTELDDRGRRLFRRVNVGFVFQNYNLVPSLTALENVLLPTLFSGEDYTERAFELLKLVGLEKRWDHLPTELSGGERQRVAIARALIKDPPVILADEPTGNIDTKQSERLMRILRGVARRGKTVVVATHDPLVVSRCTRRVNIRDGVIGGGGK